MSLEPLPPQGTTPWYAWMGTFRTSIINALAGKSASGHAHAGVYDPAGTAASGDSAHLLASDPHPGYETTAEGTAKANAAQAAAEATASGALSAHSSDTTAVHGIADTSVLVVTSDGRLSDARTPTTHAASHADGGSDEITVDQSQVTGLVTALGLKIPASEKGAGNGVATLDAGGQIPAGQIPAVAITEYLGTVANQAAMLALSGQKGDWSIRSDLGTVFVITGADPTIIGGWTQLAYPASSVVSVNSATGEVVLTAADVGAIPTSDRSNTAPANVTKAAASSGSATDMARRDHKHDVTTAAAGSQAFGDIAAEGAASSLARSDHRHAMPAAPTAASVGADPAGTGAAQAAAVRGLPLGLDGAVSATRYVGATASVAPVSGTFAAGDFITTLDGKVFICTTAGTPGTWTQVGGGGSAVGVVLFGTGLPSAGVGSDGDWYRRGDHYGTLYRKIAGAWVAVGGDGNYLDYNGGSLPTHWGWHGSRTIRPGTGASTAALMFNAANVNTSAYSVALSSFTVTVTAGDARVSRLGTMGGACQFTVGTMPGAGQTLRVSMGLDWANNASQMLPSAVINNAGVAQVDSGFSTGLFTFPVTFATGHKLFFNLMAGGCFVVHLNASNAVLGSTFIPINLTMPAVIVENPVCVAVSGHGTVTAANYFWATEAV